MRALITFIAILTVGIVTAQGSGQYQESTDIGYNTNGTITVNGETYVLDADRAAQLRTLYPNGTTKAYNWRTDKENLEYKLDRMLFSYAPGPGGDLDGDGTQEVNAYRFSFQMDEGYGGTWGFNHAIPSEAYRTDSSNTLVVELDYESRDNDDYTPAVGYRARVVGTIFNNTQFDVPNVQMGFQIRIEHPDNPIGDLYNVFPVDVYDQGLGDGVTITALIQDNLERGTPQSSIVTHTLARNTGTTVYQTRTRSQIETTVGRYIFTHSGSESISIRNKPIRIRYEIGRPIVPSNTPSFWLD